MRQTTEKAMVVSDVIIDDRSVGEGGLKFPVREIRGRVCYLETKSERSGVGATWRICSGQAGGTQGDVDAESVREGRL